MPPPPLSGSEAVLTLKQINAATQAEFTAHLGGVYEHSPWIAAATWS